MMEEVLAGSGHDGGEKVDVWDEHDDIDDIDPYKEELAVEWPWSEANSGFREAYPLSAAEARAIWIYAPHNGYY